MTEREKVIAALEWCIEKPCNPKCPYFSQEDKAQAYCLFKKIMPDALALIKTLSEDVEVWKRRYKWKCVKRTNDPEPYENPNIVKIYTSEEMEKTDHEK